MSSAGRRSTLPPGHSTRSICSTTVPSTGSPTPIRTASPRGDKETFSYDPTLAQPGPLKSLSMRAGMYVGGWELSLFGNNLTKEETPVAISHDIPGSEPYYLQSLRPLTFGLTASYRF